MENEILSKAKKPLAIKEFETNRTLTYSQFNNVANRVAINITKNFGLKRGDRVAILAENCLEFYILFSVSQKTGIILVPLNYRLTSRELDSLFQDFQPALIITQQKFQNSLDNRSNYKSIQHKWSLEELQEFGMK